MSISSRSISGISFPLKTWQYLILFQSLSQFLSWICVVAIAGVLLEGIILIGGGEGQIIFDMFPPIAAGSLAVVLMVIKAQFSFGINEHKRRLVTEKLKWYGYIEMTK